jgi:hypothetical protein
MWWMGLPHTSAQSDDRLPQVHGDSHYFRVDKPLLDDQGRRLENFTRVETFGDNAATGLNDVQWVKALVDPHGRCSDRTFCFAVAHIGCIHRL